jgi:CBS domain-containing protein
LRQKRAEAITQLKAIMTAPVEVISPRASICTAQKRLTLKRIHHLVVIEHAKVVGLVTADVLRKRQEEGATCVSDVMLRNIIVAPPETTVREAVDLLTPGHLQTALPIVRNNELVGIVSVSDLLELAGGARRRHKRPAVVG